ncbi:hypothetical protein ACFL33_00120 [Pseudomonadota bacterium]|jgi:hypothetical protein|nr:hypothetical protein [Xanthomonadales bacterium]
MKITNLLGITALALAIGAPTGLVAQEAENKDETYIYATYFYCNTGTEDKADELVKKNMVPIYDAAVADGTIKAWGWMSHRMGGKWRRILYRTAGSIDGLLSAEETISKRMDEAMGGADDGFDNYCSAHDDYLWQAVAGGDGSAKRGKVGISVYHVCSMADEDRIDELFKKVSQPLLEKAAKEGKLSSWGWNSHVVGGQYRRLETMTGPDYSTLMKARAEIIAGIYADGNNADAIELDKLCTSHTDYLWDIVHEKAGS